MQIYEKNKTRQNKFRGSFGKGIYENTHKSDVEINIRYNVKITSNNIKRTDFLLFSINFYQILYHVYSQNYL